MSVGRAASVGLAAGLGLGAVALLISGLLALQVDCTALGAQECTFEQQLKGDIARTQAIEALGLAFVSVGLFMFARRTKPGGS